MLGNTFLYVSGRKQKVYSAYKIGGKYGLTSSGNGVLLPHMGVGNLLLVTIHPDLKSQVYYF